MDKINVKLTRTAKKYAEALFDIAKKKGQIDIVLLDLNLIADVLNESSDLKTFLTNPVISLPDKKDVLKKLFESRVSEITMNFLYLLSDNSRFEMVSEILNEYRNLDNEFAGIVTVNAISAVPVKDYLRDKLKAKLESMLSRQVLVKYDINPDIIAGLIVEIDGKTIDNSIGTKLKNIKKQLI